MSPFAERLVAEFTAKHPKGNLHEECLAAREAILKFRKTGEGTPEVAGLQWTEITADDVAAIVSVVKSFIEAFPEHPSVGPAIWTLSALDDGSLVPFFIEQIRLHHGKRNLQPVQQADYALCRLNQDIPRYQYAPGETTPEGYWVAVEEFLLRHPKA